MKLSEFDYLLPSQLIARYPAKQRDESRLMVLVRKTGQIRHHVFHELLDFLPKPGMIVRNNTRVYAARLKGVKEPQGGRVEALLLKELQPNLYECLVKPARRLKRGQKLSFSNQKALITEELADGKRIIRFEGVPLNTILEKIGQIPLPPYLEREVTEIDAERYQTVYARHSGSVAAPTAGLHFTPLLLKQLNESGIEMVDVTLHVGMGTFKPVQCQQVEDHVMHFEQFRVTQENWQKIRNRKVPLTAVGTTSVRVLETLVQANQVELSGETNLFITPGYQFQSVDHLLTNFHLPRSTLLMLVSAFAGPELIRQAYQTAIEEKYRFYSYGDAMLII